MPRTILMKLAVGIDFTARDLQHYAKEKGLPWALAKGFNQFRPHIGVLSQSIILGI